MNRELNSIYAITTHHERLSEAAEAWRELNVCAIGWSSLGNLKKVDQGKLPVDAQRFMKLQKGDLILAYAGENRIAYVGEIEDGKYKFTRRNKVGLDSDKGGFDYPNQYKVKWYDEPYDFSRKDLPEFLRDQLGRKGRTVVAVKLNGQSFDKVKQIILTCARSGSLSYDINEDTVKAGIRKYLGKNIDSLEKGLKIIKSERRIAETDQPDFIGRDKNNVTVIIECKGSASAGDCDQLERYGKKLTKEKSRLMLVAFKIDGGCIREAEKNSRMELFECNLTFKKVFPIA